jgi:thymidine kinase
MVVEGDQVVVGDVEMNPADDPSGFVEGQAPVVGYETLCRRHYMHRVTAHSADMMAAQDQSLPFEGAAK